MKIIDVQELQRIKEDLKRFRSSLPQNPSDTCLKIACFSDPNRPDIKKFFWLVF